MKYECDMIADLLPLYKDGVCSEASAAIVKDHLSECEKCSDILKKMDDSEIDEEFIREKDDVISSQAKFFKRKSALAGSIIAGVFAIPILVCLIVNLATGAGLSWFFVVLTAMFIPASLILVPLMVPQNKFIISVGSFTASLLLLLGVVCIYTGGNWFFIAASSTLFGLTVLVGPFVIGSEPVKSFLKNYKGLTLMAADSLTFAIMMICIGLSAGGDGFFKTAFAIAFPLVCIAWIIFFIIRYLPANGLMKTGIVVAALSAFCYFMMDIIFLLMGAFESSVTYVHVWTSVISPITALIVGLSVGLIFFGIGVIVKLVGRKKNEN